MKYPLVSGTFTDVTTQNTLTYNGGKLVWDIPWQYLVTTNPNYQWRFARIFTQIFVVTGNGKATASKGEGEGENKTNLSHSREASDPEEG